MQFLVVQCSLIYFAQPYRPLEEAISSYGTQFLPAQAFTRRNEGHLWQTHLLGYLTWELPHHFSRIL